MAKEVIMPKFGFTQEESEIIEWLKHDGDEVEKGDPIAVVTTDKISMEIEAPATGRLAGVRYRAGEVVPVTEVIAYILAPGESLPQSEKTAEGKKSGDGNGARARTETGEEKTTPVAARMLKGKDLQPGAIEGSGAGGRITKSDVQAYLEKTVGTTVGSAVETGKVRATPAARRIARERGLDLAGIKGSGARARIQGEDVEVYYESLRVAATAKQVTTSEAIPSIPFTGMRRTIALNMQRSAQEIPHIAFEADINMSAAMTLRERANQRRVEDQVRVTMTAVLARAVAWSLIRHPLLNSRLDGDRILLFPWVHLGIAVALEEGLVVPVVQHAENRGIYSLAEEIDAAAVRAKSGKLRQADLEGGTFTISNLGMFGVDRFTAIINPPEAGILAVGRIRDAFVPDEDGKPVLGPMLTVSLSADHRVVDGAVAARFLDDLRECLENPEIMTL